MRLQKLLPYLLRALGAALLLVGLVGAYYGPLEIYVFYLFSEGGPFYYDGFGVGSFWFAALVVQNLGYYLVAALCIPMGLGHLKLRRWGLTLTRLFLWFWLGAGILLAINASLLLPAAFNLNLDREVLVGRMAVAGAALLSLLIVIPAVALRVYASKIVQAAFEAQAAPPGWLERTPLPVLALLVLFLILILVLHVTIFFQCLFPVFGRFVVGRPVVYWIALFIVLAGGLTYGIARLKLWAWWGALGYITLLTVSTAMTFATYGFYEITQMMNLPAVEKAFIDKLVLLHDYTLAPLLVIPLVITLGLILTSKRYFSA